MPNIVIVGGGVAGLELAVRLSRKSSKINNKKITLIDESLRHVWKPLFHEIAVGTLGTQEDEVNYIAYAYQHHFQFIFGSLKSLNRAKKEIVLMPIVDETEGKIFPERVISYEILIIAIGSISHDFSIPGVKQHCLFLDKISQADSFNTSFLKEVVRLIQFPEIKNYFRVVIVGGGATGVELAAELHNALSRAVHYGLPTLSTSNFSITLIETADRILSGLPERLSAKIKHYLEKLGVIILTKQKVTRVTENGVETMDGLFIPAEIKVWAAGIQAEPLLSMLDGLETNALHQLCVRPTLQTTLDDAIFALGDCASCPQAGSQKTVPARAQAAHQQAKLLARSLSNFFNQKPLLNYVYQDYGSLIALSRYHTSGHLISRWLGNFLIEGTVARWLYLWLYKSHQVTLFGVRRVLLLMLAHTLVRKMQSRLKLH